MTWFFGWAATAGWCIVCSMLYNLSISRRHGMRGSLNLTVTVNYAVSVTLNKAQMNRSRSTDLPMMRCLSVWR